MTCCHVGVTEFPSFPWNGMESAELKKGASAIINYKITRLFRIRKPRDRISGPNVLI